MATEATSMKHAKAIAARTWPGAPVIPAMQRLQWRNGRPFSTGEDVLGVYDMLVLASEGLIGVQVTSPKNAAARRNKVFSQLLVNGVPSYLLSFVWAWHAGSHMAVWRWYPVAQDWLREADLPSPLLKSGAAPASETPSPRPETPKATSAPELPLAGSPERK